MFKTSFFLINSQYNGITDKENSFNYHTTNKVGHNDDGGGEFLERQFKVCGYTAAPLKWIGQV